MRGGWSVARFGLPLAASAALAAVVLASPTPSDGASPPSVEFGAELYAVQCAALSWQRRRRGGGPGPDDARRRRGVSRFRAPDRPHAPRRPGRPGEARSRAILRGGDPGARRLRRFDRQRARHPAHRHRGRRHGERRRPVPPELRGVPRGLRRRGTDRRGARGAQPVEGDPDAGRPGDRDRPRSDAGVRHVHARRHQRRGHLHRGARRAEHDGAIEVRRGRSGGRRAGGMAPRPDPARRPDPLDRAPARAGDP